MSRFTGMEKVFSLPACAALISFPVLLLTYPSAANTGFTTLLAWSLVTLATQRRAGFDAWGAMLRTYWPMVAAMAALPAALLLRQVVSGEVPDIPYLYLRFALFALLAWGLTRLGARLLQCVQWGLVVGAIVSAVWIHGLAENGRPIHVGINNVIPFANLTLLMGMLALISVAWDRRRNFLSIGVKLLAGAAGLYTSYISATRGGWIAIPVLLLIMLTAIRGLSARSRTAMLAVLVGGMAAAGYCSSIVKTRINDAVSNITAILAHTGHRGLDTSEGWRLQLWKASLSIIQSHPLAGVGPDGFSPTLEAMAASGFITPATAQFGHSHNDILYAGATLGVPGLLAVLALYLVPAGFFMRHVRDRDAVARVAAVMGLATSIGFLLFGLTEAMFFISMTNAFYTLMVAICFAMVIARKDPPGVQGQPDARLTAA
ncbi:O-antigen ligase family protein [Cupriavidus sp. IDO]|uniref:O-antigen ligase family protein n=1 Tax=Cupriavidus sp. IDO TaxID=1539142 RepID=UPI001EE6BC09|nr:O-antigen ligase family protein [Cupriavidus sp. IDO]